MNEMWMQEVELLRKLAPKHILFLCVANSARSQIAEGIARSLAPTNIQISSAGSKPSRVRPEAIEILREVGIDISNQYSKGLEKIDTVTIDAVITLCAEEVCPIFPHKVMKIHWGLPDPATVKGSEEDKLNAFRTVRDELLLRLQLVFT